MLNVASLEWYYSSCGDGSCRYLLSLSVAACVNEPLWSEWKEGSFSKIGRSIGGEFLVSLILIGSIGSNIGMFMTELFVDSFQLVGMAEIGLAPKVFARYESMHAMPVRSSVLGMKRHAVR